jgi:pseudouridine synthase
MERINKLLARAGVASRRGVDDLIRQGLVTLNGKIVTELGIQIDPAVDAIKVSGKRVQLNPETAVYYMLNKPRGVVSTLSDPEGRPTIKQILRGVKARVFPVGRLDFNSEGLILMTNDGEMARALTHPSSHVSKRYSVKVKGRPDDAALQKLRNGLYIDGRKTMPIEVSRSSSADHTWLNMTLREGRNQQIRKMMLAVRHPVLKLRRTSISGVELGDLASAEFRPLTEVELRRLRKAVSKSAKNG